jgi:hypothetical protein
VTIIWTIIQHIAHIFPRVPAVDLTAYLKSHNIAKTQIGILKIIKIKKMGLPPENMRANADIINIPKPV